MNDLFKSLISKLSITALFLLAILIPTVTVAANDNGEIELDIEAYAEAMQPGWNLGNTFDAVGEDETAWGNPRVTKELIDTIADQGFNSIRIPITFDQRMAQGPDYTIDEDFLGRVTDAVDWSLDAGMKVMINIHHDSWLWLFDNLGENTEEKTARFNAIWEQLSDHFKDYPVDLMFESINEPAMHEGDDNFENAQVYIDELNDSFYNIVRNSGGNNDIRPLVIPTFKTAFENDHLNALYTWIDETDDPYLIATFHYYGYWPFSVNIAGHTTFDQQTKDHIIDAFDRTHDKFTANGIPVVIGEYGLLGFDQHVGTVQQGEKLKFFEYMIHYANEKKLIHMLWDNGQHFNRREMEWNDPQLYEMMKASWEGRSAVAETNFIYLEKNKSIEDIDLQLILNGNHLKSLSVDGEELVAGEDYELSGNTLTVKAELLERLTSDELGKNAQLTASFNQGADWFFDVIVYDKPTVSQSTGTIHDFVLPVEFNGSHIATMEAINIETGEAAGPQGWTSFKEFGYAFNPSYEDNEVTFPYGPDRFFNEWEGIQDGDVVELTLYFWSGETLSYLLIREGDNIIGFEPFDIETYASDMQPGWNLGNTYDAVADVDGGIFDETAWGNPRVTEDLINQIAAQGFKSIRLPLTFEHRMDDEHKIDSDFLGRIKQTVDWSLEAGMKVMINVHHDSWIWLEEGMHSDQEASVERFNAIWEQLAAEFKDYPTDLMFESINEPRFHGEYEERLEYVEILNTEFYEIVRNSGGLNVVRPLVIPALDSSADAYDGDIIYPVHEWITELNDPNIIFTFHYYSSWPFSVNVAGFTQFYDENGETIQHMTETFDRVYETFVTDGIPVVIGEFGLLGFDTNLDTIQQGEKLKFFEYMIHYANEKDLVHMIWDNGQHFGRESLEWSDPALYEMMKASWDGRSSTAESDFVYLKQGEDIHDAELQLDLNGNQFVTVEHAGEALVAGEDYELNGDILTLKSSLLNDLVSSGELGVNAVIHLVFDSGMDWAVNVITYDTPDFNHAFGTINDFAIPVDFNGADLATMEAIFVETGEPAGPQSWTSFKQFGYVFSPSYEDNEVTFPYGADRFFSEWDNGVQDGDLVELTFHFWSGEEIKYSIYRYGDHVIGFQDVRIENLEEELEELYTLYYELESDNEELQQQIEELNAAIEELKALASQSPSDEHDQQSDNQDNDGEDPVVEGDEDEDENETTEGTVDDQEEKETAETDEENGEKLPNTATSMFNFLLAGILFVLIGCAVIFYVRKRKLEM